MNDIRVSIIIPAYNEERYLARCLDAVGAQTAPPYEVIVVDNNSSDRTAEVARRYAFVRLISEKRQGRAFAQTAGFSAASGSVLARIDADAVLPANWVAEIAQYFSQAGTQQTAWTSGASFYNIRFSRLASWLYGLIAFNFNRLLTGHASLWGSSMALPRSLWIEAADSVCMRPDIHEDLDLAIHLHHNGHRIFHNEHLKVGVELRPAYASLAALWEYLKLWPRTLRIHDNKKWPICWLVNIVLYGGMPVFSLAERTAKLLGVQARYYPQPKR